VGSEAVCRVSYKGEASEGKALLETAELIFRGDFRIKIPFNQITSLEAADGELRVGYDGAMAVFELGRYAEKWAEKIRNPRGLLDKLGVKPGMSVVVLGVEDAEFESQLRDRVGNPANELKSDADLVFYEADCIEDLSRLSELRGAIKPAGGIWVVSPKGKGAVLKDVEVMAAAREAGLVDTKVASFSATHTALKLVIPKAQR
jgi:Protein of unknown function (DUF3052)